MEGSVSKKAATAAFVESDITTWDNGDYARLLAELELVFQSKPGDASRERLTVLAELVKAYKEATYHIKEWASRPSSPEEIAEHEATKRGDSVFVAA